jgi:REP element-mobilizing transposase RayT
MRLNNVGRMIIKWWNELNRKFENMETDAFVVMPNHVHGIIVITVGADLRVCPNGEGAHAGAPLQKIIQWFKTMTTNQYMRGVKTSGWPAFDGRLWQHNYYEHIIRNDNELYIIREYIVNNPLQWELDTENPNGGMGCHK